MSCDAGELYELLWKQARLELPGSLDDVLELAFQNSLREFFQQSLTWREELQVRAFPNRQRYDLNHSVRHCKVQWVGPTDPMNDTNPTGVSFDKKPLYPLGFHTVRPLDDSAPEPRWFTIEHNSDLLLHPRPSFPSTERHVLYVNVALIPATGTISRTGCGAIPGDLLQTWFEGLLSGVLYRMMQQIHKPYTNLVVARYHQQRFKYKIAEGRQVSGQGSTFSPAPQRFPPFANRGGR